MTVGPNYIIENSVTEIRITSFSHDTLAATNLSATRGVPLFAKFAKRVYHVDCNSVKKDSQFNHLVYVIV